MHNSSFFHLGGNCNSFSSHRVLLTLTLPVLPWASMRVSSFQDSLETPHMFTPTDRPLLISSLPSPQTADWKPLGPPGPCPGPWTFSFTDSFPSQMHQHEQQE